MNTPRPNPLQTVLFVLGVASFLTTIVAGFQHVRVLGSGEIYTYDVLTVVLGALTAVFFVLGVVVHLRH